MSEEYSILNSIRKPFHAPLEGRGGEKYSSISRQKKYPDRSRDILNQMFPAVNSAYILSASHTEILAEIGYTIRVAVHVFIITQTATLVKH